MELPPIYNDSEGILVVASLKDHAIMDVFSKELLNENIDEAGIKKILDNLGVSLMAVVDAEIKANQISKTAPLISLCKFLVAQYPELVLDDDTYYIRKSIMRTHESVKANPNAFVIRDAFMDIDLPEHDKSFQIQLTAVSREQDYLDRDTIQIVTEDE